MNSESTLWGIDLGGTKIEGVVITREQPFRVLARHRVPTEAAQGYEHMIGQIAKVIGLLEATVGFRPRRIGMGTPGALDPYSHTIKNSNTTALIGQPLREDLKAKLDISFELANDANCFALAEAQMGAVPDVLPQAEVVFGIIMGTGVGGGVVVNGKVINGRHSIGGEWGHNFLDASGGKCYCGRIGCVETIFCGPALERFYSGLSGEKLRLPEIVNRARTGEDAHAVATMDRLIYFFGKAVAPVINIIDPAAIVIGGGVGNIDELYTRGVEEVKKYVFNPRLDTLFLKPKLGDSAGVFGAAELVR